MKTTHSPTRQTRQQGSVLVITMSIVVVAALVLGSYLTLVQAQSASVARSQSWNTVVSVAEAGLEEGLALVNNGAPAIITSPWAWTGTFSGTTNWQSFNGWTTMNGGQTILSRYVSGSNYYQVTVSTNGGTPTITSIGVVTYNSLPWVFTSASGPFFAAAGFRPFLAQAGSSSGTLGRKVQVQTVLNPLFTAAVVTKTNFDMKGNGVVIDSFDSSNPAYSTAGQYVTALRKANGILATDSAAVDTLNIGNGNIYGRVLTGPGSVQNVVEIKNNGAVGDANWNATQSGIQAGAWSGNFNVNIPDVTAPATGSPTLPAPVSGVINLNGGNYTVSSVSSSLNITAPTTLWVQGSFSSGVTIATTNNASLTLYVGRTSGTGDSIDLSGQSTINQPGYAANLQIYGLPSLTSISLTGNAGFIGTIYAPEADLKGGGGGKKNLDTSGAMIVNSVTLNGHWNFHYDENLVNTGPTRGWIPKSWTEMKYTGP